MISTNLLLVRAFERTLWERFHGPRKGSRIPISMVLLYLAARGHRTTGGRHCTRQPALLLGSIGWRSAMSLQCILIKGIAHKANEKRPAAVENVATHDCQKMELLFFIAKRLFFPVFPPVCASCHTRKHVRHVFMGGTGGDRQREGDSGVCCCCCC